MSRATAEDIHTVLRDALRVYRDTVDAQVDSPVWAGEENGHVRTWLRQRRVLAAALIGQVEAIPEDVLKLTLFNGLEIEI
jgi:hypothetical protein